MAPRLTPDQIRRIQTLHAAGESARYIAADVGVSLFTVQRWRELGPTCPECGSPMGPRSGKCGDCRTGEWRRGYVPPKDPGASGSHACVASPTRAHHWDIDGENHGVCRHCSARGYFPSIMPWNNLAE